MSTRVFIKQSQSPGDILMLTCAVRDLKTSKPEWKVNVKTSISEIWDHNPYLSRTLKEEDADHVIDADYGFGINRSSQRPLHFARAFTNDLEKKLNLKIPSVSQAGDIFLSQEEWSMKSPFDDFNYWLISPTGKFDYSAKWWNPNHAQKVVDHFRGRILFIQTGSSNHWHPPLKGVVDLVGKTTMRQFITLTAKSSGTISPVTFLMHLSAATPLTRNRGVRPSIVLAGGREPPSWVGYNGHSYLSKIGTMKCCAHGGCWKSKASDTACEQEMKEPPKPKTVCEFPIDIPGFTIENPNGKCGLKIAKCLNDTSPEEVISIIETIHENRFDGYDTIPQDFSKRHLS